MLNTFDLTHLGKSIIKPLKGVTFLVIHLSSYQRDHHRLPILLIKQKHSEPNIEITKSKIKLLQAKLGQYSEIAQGILRFQLNIQKRHIDIHPLHKELVDSNQNFTWQKFKKQFLLINDINRI